MGAATRWRATALVGLVIVVAYATVPRAVHVCQLLAVLAAVAAAVGCFRAASGSRSTVRRIWATLTIATILSGSEQLASWLYTVVDGSAARMPNVFDAFWLSAFGAYFVALFSLGRHRRRGWTAGEILDAAMLVIAGSSVLWVFAMSPIVSAGGIPVLQHVLFALFPICNVAVLALLVVLAGGPQRNSPVRMLVGGFAALMAGDCVYVWDLWNNRIDLPNVPYLLWTAHFLFIGLASVQPTARRLPGGDLVGQRLSASRITFLSAALVLGPILYVTHPRHHVVLACTSLLTFALVIARMSWLNRKLVASNAVVQESAQQLEFRASHDELTGLPNRTLIVAEIDRMLRRQDDDAAGGAVLFVDLDGFKRVNDSLGHAVGDELLRSASARFADNLRDRDTIGRVGGDEFVVVLDGPVDDDVAEVVAQRLIDVTRRPFDLSGHQVQVTTSIGIGVAAGGHQTSEELLHQADLALYRAKSRGRDCYEVFSSGMNEGAQRRYELGVDLRTALRDEQFHLQYQPIYRLSDMSLAGAEALLRWDHPVRGRISPDEFIPLLEGNGMMVAVGRWVVTQACRQAALWRDSGADLAVTVNVSARQLDGDTLAEDVRVALAGSGLSPEALVLEITETALMDDVTIAAQRLRELKATGVRIAMDDFGTGYSSLAYLQTFPVDCMKIDRAFTNRIGTSVESDVLIHAMAELGRNLGLKTLAEGVENTSELMHLRALNVNSAQGFLLSRPLDPETLERDVLAPAREGRAPDNWPAEVAGLLVPARSSGRIA